MRNTILKKREIRQKRSWRVRKTLSGTASRPRLSVHKSNKHCLAQLIDDERGVTLGSCATFSKQFQGTPFAKKGKAAARELGVHIAKIAKDLQIEEVIFDRGPFKYHGMLQELADAAREGGLRF